MPQNVKIDKWVEALLVDPLGKEPIRIESGEIKTEYGSHFPITDGIYDFRMFSDWSINKEEEQWIRSQDDYEKLSKEIKTDPRIDYSKEIEDVREVYKEIPIIGRCLDVGGLDGRLRAFLQKDQEYLIIDPYLSVFNNIEKHIKLIETYPFILEPVNFICGTAEYLPIESNSFQTIHMRSVIDHFLFPKIALLEAFRVLERNGQLIVGLYVAGGKTGNLSNIEKTKKTIKPVFTWLGLVHEDHHIWHPTYKQLCDLIQHCGFTIKKTHWQSNWNDKVCYIQAIKP